MTQLETLENIQKKIDRLEATKQQTIGARNQMMAELKANFGVDSLEDAIALYKEKKAAYDDTEAAFQKALQEFTSKWGDTLARLV